MQREPENVAWVLSLTRDQATRATVTVAELHEGGGSSGTSVGGWRGRHGQQAPLLHHHPAR